MDPTITGEELAVALNQSYSEYLISQRQDFDAIHIEQDMNIVEKINFIYNASRFNQVKVDKIKIVKKLIKYKKLDKRQKLKDKEAMIDYQLKVFRDIEDR